MAVPHNITRCAVYLRVSLDPTGEGLAVDRQREDCRKLAEQRGWEIYDEYVDNSVSAFDKSKHRPEYDRMCADYAAGQFKALVCWDLDRLTRQPRQLEDWCDAAEHDGLILVTANGEADLSTDGGQMFARVKSAFATAEMQRKSARQKRAALQRSQQGKPPKGVRLTGYSVDGEIIEDEAAVVRQIFERFAAGDSLKGIARWLGESGAQTRSGRAWNPSSVRTILVNPRYAGRAVYRGEETGKPGAWEAIIDEATFALVTSKLADPRRKVQHGTDRKHLGSGLYECGYCDLKVSSWSGGRYRCREAHVNRSMGIVDDYVLTTVRARLARSDLADLIAPRTCAEVQRYTEELRGLRARMAQIEDDYDSGLIDGRRYATATEKVRVQSEAVEAKLARATSGTAATSILAAPDPQAAFDAAPLMIRRAVVDTLCTVRLLRAPRGRKTFDPETVKIEPKTAA